jgi:hypothetical protein
LVELFEKNNQIESKPQMESAGGKPFLGAAFLSDLPIA